MDSTSTTPPEAGTYTAPQIAALLQTSVRHMRRLDDQRVIPGRLRVGRLVRFHRAAVDAWLAQGGVKGAS